jgi:hypothetical protein
LFAPNPNPTVTAYGPKDPFLTNDGLAKYLFKSKKCLAKYLRKHDFQ